MSFINPAFQWINREIGVKTLFDADRDTHLLMICRFLRMIAYGAAALVLGIFLYTNGMNKLQIGYFMTLSLLGDAAISFFLTMMADKIGRRRVLLVGSLLMTATGIVFALSNQYWLLLSAAIVGVMTPGAHEVGPFRAVEVSDMKLPRLSSKTDFQSLHRSRSLLSSHPLKHAPIFTRGTPSFPPSGWPSASPPQVGSRMPYGQYGM